MSKVAQKGLEKLLGKFVDAEVIEPLGDLLVKLVSIVDVDQRTEVKIKVIPVQATDFNTGKKERFICLGFRIVEPDEHELLREQVKAEWKKEKRDAAKKK